MNKRITSLALVFTLVLTLLATAVPALAAPSDPLCTFTVEADKTSANPGEEITYTISMEQIDTLTTFAFYLAVPSGLTYVADSAVLGETAVSRLGVTYEFVPEADLLLTWYDVNGNDYTYTDKLELMTFKCTVDSDAVIGQNYEVGLTLEGVAAGSTGDYNEITEKTAVVPVTITVAAAPKPATGIELNKTETTIYTGSEETLIATVEPADTTDTVTWISSDTAVATVDNAGKVTAVAPGKTTITATAGSQSATCAVTVENAPCTHTNKTDVGAKSSTCKEQGWEAYSKCDDCGQLFDKDGNEISAIPYLELADHTAAQTASAEYLKSEATCTSAAVYYEHCSVCDEQLNTTFTSGSTAPHTESGWKSDADGHWKVCTVCGEITTTKVAHTPDHEGNATEEYAIKCTECGWEIEAQLGHTHSMTKVEAKDPTCTEVGNSEYYVCSGCGDWFEDATGNVLITDHDSVVIGALGHDMADATCTAPKTCKRCGTTEGDPLGHEYEAVWSSNADEHWHACVRCDAKTDEAEHTPDRDAATETEPVKCSVCDYEIEPALGHTHSLTKVDAKTATCTEAGNSEYYVCAGCGDWFEDATGSVQITDHDSVEIPALGHDWADATCTDPKTCKRCGATEGEALGHSYATAWSSDAANHWHECTVCGDKADEAAHTPGEEATETIPQTCTECGYILVPALGHTHSLIKVEAKAATCTEDGNIEHYICDACIELFADEDAAEELTPSDVVIPATGHNYEWVIDKEATATEKGSKHEECKVCHDKKAAVEIPATGTTDPGKTDSSKPVQTGDNGMMGLWIALLAVSGAGMIGVAMFGRKKNRSVR